MPHSAPEGRPTVIPRIFTPNVADVVHYIKSVFDAEGDLPTGAPAELKIGNSIIMVSDGGGLRQALPACLYVYVEDTEQTYRRAIKAGAVAIEEPADMPYGDRRASVRDPWGNLWQIATYRGAAV